MKQVMAGAAALLVLAMGNPAAAQQTPKPAEPHASVEQAVEASGLVPALEALAAAAAPELERTMEQLTTTFNVLATRIAEDAELRASAARAARGLAEVAESAVVEHAVTLQEALRALADRIEARTATRDRRLEQ
jgi:hypothetical protein